MIRSKLCGSRAWETVKSPSGKYYTNGASGLQVSVPGPYAVLASAGSMEGLLARFAMPVAPAMPPEVAEDMESADVLLYLPELPGGLGGTAAGAAASLPIREIWLEARRDGDRYLVSGACNTASERDARGVVLVLRLGLVQWLRTQNLPDVSERLKSVTITADGSQVKLAGLSFAKEELVPVLLGLVGTGTASAVKPGRVAVVDYGAGNLRSVQNALAHLGIPHEVTSDPEAVRRADTVVFPGVGEASSAMRVLSRTGLGEAIRETHRGGRRLIGICLGCQVILDRSEEGGTECLGLLPGVVRRFVPGTRAESAPHGLEHGAVRRPPRAARRAGRDLLLLRALLLPRARRPRGRGRHGRPRRHVRRVHRLGQPRGIPVPPREVGSRRARPAGRVPGLERVGGAGVLQKRVIVCLDVRDGRTTKGVKFRDNADVGDPVAMARFYYEEGVDELVFYDITASAERRPIMIEVVRRVGEAIFIPFSVGGGIASVEDMRAVLLAGAEKVSVNSPAVRSPRLIADGAAAFGSQCVVLGMDALADPAMPSGYRVVIDGGRTPTDLDALAWAREAERLGAGEIVLNSIDADGTKQGYELDADAHDLGAPSTYPWSPRAAPAPRPPRRRVRRGRSRRGARGVDGALRNVPGVRHQAPARRARHRRAERLKRSTARGHEPDRGRPVVAAGLSRYIS